MPTSRILFRRKSPDPCRPPSPSPSPPLPPRLSVGTPYPSTNPFDSADVFTSTTPFPAIPNAESESKSAGRSAFRKSKSFFSFGRAGKSKTSSANLRASSSSNDIPTATNDAANKAPPVTMPNSRSAKTPTPSKIPTPKTPKLVSLFSRRAASGSGDTSSSTPSGLSLSGHNLSASSGSRTSASSTTPSASPSPFAAARASLIHFKSAARRSRTRSEVQSPEQRPSNGIMIADLAGRHGITTEPLITPPIIVSAPTLSEDGTKPAPTPIDATPVIRGPRRSLPGGPPLDDDDSVASVYFDSSSNLGEQAGNDSEVVTLGHGARDGEEGDNIISGGDVGVGAGEEEAGTLSGLATPCSPSPADSMNPLIVAPPNTPAIWTGGALSSPVLPGQRGASPSLNGKAPSKKQVSSPNPSFQSITRTLQRAARKMETEAELEGGGVIDQRRLFRAFAPIVLFLYGLSFGVYVSKNYGRLSPLFDYFRDGSSMGAVEGRVVGVGVVLSLFLIGMLVVLGVLGATIWVAARLSEDLVTMDVAEVFKKERCVDSDGRKVDGGVVLVGGLFA